MDVQTVGSAAVAFGGPAVAVAGLFLKSFLSHQGGGGGNPSHLPSVPEIPGLPLLGNLLELKEKKPYKTFTKWADTYGPIYSIKAGATSMVVINSNDLAKEALVTKFNSISTRKLSKALKILTADKTMVAMSDYDDYHKTVKRNILTSILGPAALKKHRIHRDTLAENLSNQLHDLAINSPHEAVNLRKIFQSELFTLALKQTFGRDIKSIYVSDLGITMTRDEVFQVLVLDPMMGAIEVDWRDFFPYLSWIPNTNFEAKIEQMYIRREAVMKALIEEHKKCTHSGENLNSYIDYLLSEAQPLTEIQLIMSLWEPIIETSDTTMVTTEWAMYELAKNPEKQARLYDEIQSVCGSEKITEEKLCKMPYLCAVFHETLRRHSPVSIIPLRYVHENTELGGYHVPSGTETTRRRLALQCVCFPEDISLKKLFRTSSPSRHGPTSFSLFPPLLSNKTSDISKVANPGPSSSSRHHCSSTQPLPSPPTLAVTTGATVASILHDLHTRLLPENPSQIKVL